MRRTGLVVQEAKVLENVSSLEVGVTKHFERRTVLVDPVGWVAIKAAFIDSITITLIMLRLGRPVRRCSLRSYGCNTATNVITSGPELSSVANGSCLSRLGKGRAESADIRGR